MCWCIIDWLVSHQVGVGVYILVHLATYYLVVNILSKNHFKKRDSPELLKYEPFCRTDLDCFGMLKNFPQIMTFWPRFFILMGNLALYCLIVTVLMIGVDTKNPKVGKVRYQLIKRLGQFCCRF